MLTALAPDGVTEKRIGSIVRSREDGVAVMRYNDKAPYKGRMRVHPASLVECFERGVVWIEVKVRGAGWIRTTPRKVLEEAVVMESWDLPIREFYLPLPEWERISPRACVYVERTSAQVVRLEPMDAEEVKARYLRDGTAEQLTLC